MRCFECYSEMVKVDYIKEYTWYCSKCDEYYFDKAIYIVCYKCGKPMGRYSELVSLKKLHGNIELSCCDECLGGRNEED